MPRLRDYPFRISYGPADDRLQEFYLPALSASVRYDRSTGFFSSTALTLAAQGVARLIANGGTMRLLVGAQLHPDDLEAIKQGHELDAMVAKRMLAALTNLEDVIVRRRLEALAWMVAAGTLTIKVVLPTDSAGNPLPAPMARDYYHPKAGIFTDAAGDQVAFNGSINETAAGWVHNYEQFAVYRSWDDSRPYLLQEVRRFNRLWDGQEPFWRALPIPQAVQAQLLCLAPAEPPSCDPLESTRNRASRQENYVSESKDAHLEPQERLLWQFVRDAPYLPQAGTLGLATCAITPWPHQVRVVEAIVERFPERFLLADEVGLGKTIEAGLALRQLILSGRVRRALILAPKSVCKQWQEELLEKFLLNIKYYNGQFFVDAHQRVFAPGKDNPWEEFPFILASSQLAKRRERAEQLLAAPPWDLIIVDEAHHARRKDVLSDRYRPNRLLSLLEGSRSRPGLQDRTAGLLLMTATPMQIHPVEVWDLLKILGLSGRWGAHESNFLRYFQELRRADWEEVNWPFVLELLRDYLATGGSLDPDFCEAAERQLGPVTWEEIRRLPFSPHPDRILKHLTPPARGIVWEMARRHTPVQRFLWRNTRRLLHKYREVKILKENVPQRRPELVWIDMRPEEQQLYNRIEEYISDFYQKYESERKGLGFIMTVYRRRLTSSFYALKESLQRRLDFLTGRPQTDSAFGLTDDDREQDDLDQDIDEVLAGEAGLLARQEIDYIKDFLRELKVITNESKVERLFADLHQLLTQREKVLIFTQYTDTMDYLREQLRSVYGSQVACYSGRGGERWDGAFWREVSKEEIKNQFKQGEQIKILLCTEAASEGLNLQTCGVLINYDMPWNPMRVEQRIGRIDRIGQTYAEVWIKNYFYTDTVEAIVYHRLGDRISWFEDVVGELQPILSRVGQTIQAAALASGSTRQQILEREISRIKEELDAQAARGFNLEGISREAPVSPGMAAPPLTLADLAGLFQQSIFFQGRLQPHPAMNNTFLLTDHPEAPLVTFLPEVFEEHPQAVRLLSYGEDLFARLLDTVPEPEEAADRVGIVRCQITQPLPLRGYYSLGPTGPEEIKTLQELEAVIKSGDLGPWTDATLQAAQEAFFNHIDHKVRQLKQLHQTRVAGAARALEEEARSILLKAGIVDLMLHGETPLVPDDLTGHHLEQVIMNLRRHRFPFAPLLLKVDTSPFGLMNGADYYQRIQPEPHSALERRFEALKEQAIEILNKLSSTQRTLADDNLTGVVASQGNIEVKILRTHFKTALRR